MSVKSCHSFLKTYQVASLPPQSKAEILMVGSKSVSCLYPLSPAFPSTLLCQHTQIRQTASHLGPWARSPSGTSRCPQSTCLLPIFAQIWPAWQGFLSFTPVLLIPTLSHLLYFPPGPLSPYQTLFVLSELTLFLVVCSLLYSVKGMRRSLDSFCRHSLSNAQNTTWHIVNAPCVSWINE